MTELWMPLQDVSTEEGKECIITEPSIWNDPINRFELPYSILEPLKARVHLWPQVKSCLVRGTMQGKIMLPCSRCNENTYLLIDREFDIFEQLFSEEEKSDIGGPYFLRQIRGELEIDIAGILWEQFVLNIPVKVLCSEDCAGLCPHCGQNLNNESCVCENMKYDQRMEIFRKLKIV